MARKALSLLIVTDFYVRSGYKTIVESVAGHLSETCDVTVLGKGYDGSQHDYPFQLIPTHYEWLPQHVTTIVGAKKVDWLLFSLDIPKTIAILKNIRKTAPKVASAVKIASAFPVESYPLTRKWVQALRELCQVRFTFTEFGMTQLKQSNLPAHLLPVGVDDFWYQVSNPADQAILEKLYRQQIGRYVLTVGDNQFRKNLIQSMIVAKTAIDSGAVDGYVVVTPVDAPDGWDLIEAATSREVDFPLSKLVLYSPSEVSRAQLKVLYEHASAFLLLSMAEGIGLPIYEAQACGLSVVSMDHTGAKEANQQADLRVSIRDKFLFPWGNVYFHLPDLCDAAGKLDVAIKQAPNVVKFPSWQLTASKIISVLSTFAEYTGDKDEQAKEPTKHSSAKVIDE